MILPNDTTQSHIFATKDAPSLLGRDRVFRDNGDGTVTAIHHYRMPDGRKTSLQETVPVTPQSERYKAKARLIEKAEQRSLTASVVLWEDMVDLTVKQNDGAGMPWVYAAIRKSLAGPIDKTFSDRYQDYIDDMEELDRAVNTISNHKSAIQRVLNLAYKRGKIDSIPVRDFGIKREFRARVWRSDEERQRFFNAMRDIRPEDQRGSGEPVLSHLYWSMLLLERRPIRARSDLWRLTDDNLVLFGQGAPYLRFVAKKTGAKVSRETIIPLRWKSGEVMDDILEYFSCGRPAGCRLLFPGRNGEPMGKPRRHFETICGRAQIVDLHIHDFKHIATSNMLNHEGWDIKDFLKLGLQFSEEIVKRVYWQKDAMSALPVEKTEQERKVL